jgi:hypothetical protein
MLDRNDPQLIRNFVFLGIRILKRHQWHYGSGQERQKELGCELRLQLKHVVVKPAIGTPMSFNIQVEDSLFPRVVMLGFVDELQEGTSGVVKILMRENNVINGNCVPAVPPFHNPGPFSSTHSFNVPFLETMAYSLKCRKGGGERQVDM